MKNIFTSYSTLLIVALMAILTISCAPQQKRKHAFTSCFAEGSRWPTIHANSNDGKLLLFTSVTYTTTTVSGPAVGATFGTSGCQKEEEMAFLHKQQRAYVVANLERLREDIAKGEGKHLDASVILMGCPNSAKPHLVHSLRNNPDFLSTGAEHGKSDQAWKKFKSIIKDDPLLNHSCQIGT